MYQLFGNFKQLIYGRSYQWRKVRSEFLKKNNKCAACGRKDNLEVHHIVPYHVDNTKELEIDNLIVLCDKYCHFIFGHLGDWKSWNSNVVNDCKEYYRKRINRPQLTHFYQMQPPKEHKNENISYGGGNIICKLFKRWYYRSKNR